MLGDCMIPVAERLCGRDTKVYMSDSSERENP